MKAGFRFFPAAVVLLALLASAGSKASSSSAAGSMEDKLRHLHSNGALPHPDPAPTVFTEPEINAYFASGRVTLPAGVRSVRFQGQPGVITGRARVDFDQIKAGQRNANPLLSVFSGIHDVVVTAHARGAAHMGYVDVDSVSLDDVEIPRFVLELFAKKYLTPRYPGVGLNSRFPLPDRIGAAAVQTHRLVVSQK